jgi:glycerophosphoryl diester phosphodiesterase
VFLVIAAPFGGAVLCFVCCYLLSTEKFLTERKTGASLEGSGPSALELPIVQPANWRVLIQSFSAESLMEIHEAAPSLPLIQLYWAGTRKSIQRDLDAMSAYAVGIGPYKQDVDAALVEAALPSSLSRETATRRTL